MEVSEDRPSFLQGQDEGKECFHFAAESTFFLWHVSRIFLGLSSSLETSCRFRLLQAARSLLRGEGSVTASSSASSSLSCVCHATPGQVTKNRSLSSSCGSCVWETSCVWPSITQGGRHAHRVRLRFPLPLCPFSQGVAPTFPTPEKDCAYTTGYDPSQGCDGAEEENLGERCSSSTFPRCPERAGACCGLKKNKEGNQIPSKDEDVEDDIRGPRQHSTGAPPKAEDEAARQGSVEKAARSDWTRGQPVSSQASSADSAQGNSSPGIFSFGSSPSPSFRFDASLTSPLPVSSAASPFLCVPRTAHRACTATPCAAAVKPSAVTVECCCVLFRALNGCCHHVLAFLLLLAQGLLGGRHPKCVFKLEASDRRQEENSVPVNEEVQAPFLSCPLPEGEPGNSGCHADWSLPLPVKKTKELETDGSSDRRNGGGQVTREPPGGDARLGCPWLETGVTSSPLHGPSAPLQRDRASEYGRSTPGERGDDFVLSSCVLGEVHINGATDVVREEDFARFTVPSVSSSIEDCLAAVSSGGCAEAEEGGDGLPSPGSCSPGLPPPCSLPAPIPSPSHPQSPPTTVGPSSSCLLTSSSCPRVLPPGDPVGGLTPELRVASLSGTSLGNNRAQVADNPGNENASVRSSLSSRPDSQGAPHVAGFLPGGSSFAASLILPVHSSRQARFLCKPQGQQVPTEPPGAGCSFLNGDEETRLSSPAVLSSGATTPPHKNNKTTSEGIQREGNKEYLSRFWLRESSESSALSRRTWGRSVDLGGKVVNGQRDSTSQEAEVPLRGDDQESQAAQHLRWWRSRCHRSADEASLLEAPSASPARESEGRADDCAVSDAPLISPDVARELGEGGRGVLASPRFTTPMCGTSSNSGKRPVSQDDDKAPEGALRGTKRGGPSLISGCTPSGGDENRVRSGTRDEAAVVTSPSPRLSVPGWETEYEEELLSPRSSTRCLIRQRNRGKGGTRSKPASSRRPDATAVTPVPGCQGCILSNVELSRERAKGTGNRISSEFSKSPCSRAVRTSPQLFSAAQTPAGASLVGGGKKRKREQDGEEIGGTRKPRVSRRHSDRDTGALHGWSPISVVNRGSGSGSTHEMRRPLQSLPAAEEDAIFEESETDVTQEVCAQKDGQGGSEGEKTVSRKMEGVASEEGDIGHEVEKHSDVLSSFYHSSYSPPGSGALLRRKRVSEAPPRSTPLTPSGTAEGGLLRHVRSSDSLVQSAFFSPASFLSTSPTPPRLRRASAEVRLRRGSPSSVTSSSSSKFWSPLSATSPSSSAPRRSSSSHGLNHNVAACPGISPCISPISAPSGLLVSGSPTSPRSPSARLPSHIDNQPEENCPAASCGGRSVGEAGGDDIDSTTENLTLSSPQPRITGDKGRSRLRNREAQAGTTPGRRAHVGPESAEETRLTPDMKKELWRKVAARFSTPSAV